MLNITRYDLRKKSDRQLAALFNDLNSGIAAYTAASPERALVISLLAMVALEQAVRAFRP